MKIKTTITSIFIILLTVFLSLDMMAQTDCVTENQIFRADKDKWVYESPKTPLTPEMLSVFEGLYYYDINCAFKLKGILTLSENPQKVNVGTTDGGTVQLINYGTVSINIKGEDHTFILYKNIDMPEFSMYSEAYFIPFKDATSIAPLSTTYASGRYLKIDLPANGNKVILDFNEAINPFASYNPTFTSLVTPPQNVMAAPIATGERKYEDR